MLGKSTVSSGKRGNSNIVSLIVPEGRAVGQGLYNVAGDKQHRGAAAPCFCRNLTA